MAHVRDDDIQTASLREVWHSLQNGDSLGGVEMLADVIRSVPNCPPKVAMTRACRDFLVEHSVPSNVIDALEAAARASFVTVGDVTFLQVSDLPRENLEEANRACIEHGFLVIGSGLNGDPIALEISTGRMAFISHDLLWDGSYGDFDECVVRTPWPLHEFWERAASDPNFPVDCHDAETLRASVAN